MPTHQHIPPCSIKPKTSPIKTFINIPVSFIAASLLALGNAASAESSPAICANYWQTDQAYHAGDVRSHLGRNYRANWWTQAMRPDRAASRSEWQDLGPCQYPAHSVITLRGDQLTPITGPAMQIGTHYRVHILLPANYQPDRAYSTLYVADWSWLGERSSMQDLLRIYEQREVPLSELRSVPEQITAAEAAGEASPVIVIGLECPDDLLACQIRRERDFTPNSWAPEEDYIRGVLWPELPAGLTVSGGGEAFGRFLRETVIPHVEQRFRVDPKQRGWLGTSLSGLWGLSQLNQRSRLFSHYLLNSPSLWYADGAVLTELTAQSPVNLRGIRTVYLSSGSEEAAEQPLLDLLGAQLREKQIPTEQRTLPAATHLSAPSSATRIGLPLVYPASSAP